MARIRSLKPEFFTDDELGALCPVARLLFAGLWCQADRAGRLEDRPARIKITVLPYDDVDANELLQQLHDAGFIVRYNVGGKRYVQVTNFARHQCPNVKEPDSIIPAPCQHSTDIIPEQSEHEKEFHFLDQGRVGKDQEHAQIARAPESRADTPHDDETVTNAVASEAQTPRQDESAKSEPARPVMAGTDEDEKLELECALMEARRRGHLPEEFWALVAEMRRKGKHVTNPTAYLCSILDGRRQDREKRNTAIPVSVPPPRPWEERLAEARELNRQLMERLDRPVDYH